MASDKSNERPRPLLIAGHPRAAADLALRRTLRAKDRGQPLIVFDYQGTLASLLSTRNKGSLDKSPLLWVDVANRRRPAAMFRFGRSPGMKQALTAFLGRCLQSQAQGISATAIAAVVDLADRVAEQGTIGLAGLAGALRRPELMQGLRRDPQSAAEVERIVSILDWALRFPSVWAMSEGNNIPNIHRALAAGATVWIEIASSHLESVEHQWVSWMAEAALSDALCSLAARQAADTAPLILYGLPGSPPLCIEDQSLRVKHVGVFPWTSPHALPAAAAAWLEAGADCWIVGAIGRPSERKAPWLSSAERERLGSLEPDQVWVRSGASRTAVTTIVRAPEMPELLAQGFRRAELQRLRHCPVKQFSSAAAAGTDRAPANADLYSALCAKASLLAGWFRVKVHNKHSQGCDGVTIEDFGARLDEELGDLSRELCSGRYRARPLRTVRLPKDDGDYRVVRVACVRDRVVQAACLQLLEPLFDPRFSAASFAYRPGRSAHHALALARSAIRSGKRFAVTADIRKCFDTIDHDILLRLVGDVVADRDVIRLLQHWLTAEVLDFMELVPSELGVPQGEAISPLLANIYLDPMDKEFERTGLRFMRYADDYLILCDTEAEAKSALRLMSEYLAGNLRLTLKPAKTQYAPVSAGIRFLGFELRGDELRIPAEKLGNLLDVLREHAATLALADALPREKWQAGTRINATIRGFRNYFLIDDAPLIRGQLAEFDKALAALGSGVGDDSAAKMIWTTRERFLPDDSAARAQNNVVNEIACATGAYVHEATEVEPLEPTPQQGQGERKPADPASPATTAPKAATAGEADVQLVDGRLHVMTSGCYVTVNGEDLCVRRRKQEVFRVPLAELSLVYLEGKGIALSSDLTMRLCDRDVPVVFTPLIGRPAAVAQSLHTMRANVRQQQVMRRNDPAVLRIGLGMLAAKVANQASVLKYFARYRRKKGDAAVEPLDTCADELRAISATIDALDPAAAGMRVTAMGHEGRAAAKYWSAIGLLLPDGVEFVGRFTRHATDALNSAVNYVYTLMYGEVWRAIVRCGLDPYFGIMHGTERDQGSLVFDLIEEYRAPFGDRLVLGLLGRGFELSLDKEGLLRPRCRQKMVTAFYKQWHREVRWAGRARSPADILEQQAASLRKMFLGTDEYRSFRFRW